MWSLTLRNLWKFLGLLMRMPALALINLSHQQQDQVLLKFNSINLVRVLFTSAEYSLHPKLLAKENQRH